LALDSMVAEKVYAKIAEKDGLKNGWQRASR
jgi:hypothetical protein